MKDTMSLVKIKLVAVGDENSGKMLLLHTYTCGSYPNEYKPVQFDDYTTTMMRDGEPFEIKFCNTGNMRSDKSTEPTVYDKLRPLIYPQTDIFLVCISVVSPPPIDVIKEMWIPELRYHCTHAPFLLVGTETDLRQDAMTHTEEGPTVKDTAPRAITPDKGNQMAKELGAAGYVECSARTQEGLKNVFDEAIEIVFKERKRRGKSRSEQGRHIIWSRCNLL